MERPVCNPLEVGQKMREKERVSLSSSPPPPRQVSSWAQECLSDRGIMGADGSLQKKRELPDRSLPTGSSQPGFTHKVEICVENVQLSSNELP